ncbi:hypothetical protein EVU96_09450, partial [Bacillus infantis]|uniref:hypothetical protein n=1 Tax=Bacillus infantis TaxID=324767 RepID=UPI0010D417B8
MGIFKYPDPITGEYKAVDSGAINDGTNKYTPSDIKNIDTRVGSLSKVRAVQEFVATEGQTVFTLNGKYEIGKNLVEVIVGGVPQSVGKGFTESSDTTITISEGLPAGTTVKVTRYENFIPTSTNHKGIHYVGGQDEIDVTQLKNFKEKVDDKISGVS